MRKNVPIYIALLFGITVFVAFFVFSLFFMNVNEEKTFSLYEITSSATEPIPIIGQELVNYIEDIIPPNSTFLDDGLWVQFSSSRNSEQSGLVLRVGEQESFYYFNYEINKEIGTLLAQISNQNKKTHEFIEEFAVNGLVFKSYLFDGTLKRCIADVGNDLLHIYGGDDCKRLLLENLDGKKSVIFGFKKPNAFYSKIQSLTARILPDFSLKEISIKGGDNGFIDVSYGNSTAFVQIAINVKTLPCCMGEIRQTKNMSVCYSAITFDNIIGSVVRPENYTISLQTKQIGTAQHENLFSQIFDTFISSSEKDLGFPGSCAL